MSSTTSDLEDIFPSSSAEIPEQTKECEKAGIKEDEGLEDIDNKDLIDLTAEKDELNSQINDEEKQISYGQDNRKKKAKKVNKIRLKAFKQLVPMLEKREEDVTKQRITILREITQVILALASETIYQNCLYSEC